jgi:ABC-type Na+ transport system ATPase subunit NatA
VVLLAQPTHGMTAAQERLFFQFLREALRPGQIVLLTSDKASTEAFADEVMHISQSGSVVAGAGDEVKSRVPDRREIGNGT